MTWIQKNKLIAFLALLKFILPFFLSDPVWELQRDEYLYYQQGQHLDFGFLENPPMIGVLAWISAIFGGSAFTIKFWPALFGATICDNGTFLLWIPDSLQFTNLIFVGRHLPGKDDEVFNHFEKVTLIDSVTDPLSRKFGDKVIFFQHADSLAAPLARKGLNEMKAEF